MHCSCKGPEFRVQHLHQALTMACHPAPVARCSCGILVHLCSSANTPTKIHMNRHTFIKKMVISNNTFECTVDPGQNALEYMKFGLHIKINYVLFNS